MEYTAEQLKAAYALNLCTVSISQIIDYDDINVMEQEYEAILNNLNIEQMPKDDALLSILKQILDTITFFRIQDVDKKLIEKEYQQKMKNAIWSAVPNIGLLIAGGNPVTMAISLASQVGIGYMNYRKAKYDIDLENENRRWELERTAVEQFNGLRRELFDTAWRLSAAYNFPDQLRLTEHQIKQYDSILMDNDLVRKFERLDAISDDFVAYPPFWYYFGNTANAIANSDLTLGKTTRDYYRSKAKELFFKYRETNQYGLLREDPISASCALELIDLLDYKTEGDLISELLEEAIRYSGKANDILQLAAIDYLKLNDHKNAAAILRQLVNEQYNTILNAQLLSSIYVKNYVSTKSAEVMGRYEILKTQVGEHYLYPMPADDTVSMDSVEAEFISMQKDVLKQKYAFATKAFIEKYMLLFGKLIPVVQDGRNRTDAYFLSNDYAVQVRKHELAKVFSNPRKTSEYIALLQEASIPYSIIDLLNEMFNACCELDFMTEEVQDRLSLHIEKAIIENKDILNDINRRVNDGQVDYIDMEKILDMRFTDFTGDFFLDFLKEIDEYINSRIEMQDLAIAEENLTAFCENNKLPDPYILLEMGENTLVETQDNFRHRFSIELLGDKILSTADEISDEQKMLTIIREAIPKIVLSWEAVEFFTNEDPRKERYFRNKEKLRTNSRLMANTLAILDDKAKRGDYDLLFTTQGIVAVKGGAVRAPVPYENVAWSTGKTKVLIIDGKFENGSLNLENLYKLIQDLKKYSKPLISTTSSFRFPEFRNPFAKK